MLYSSILICIANFLIGFTIFTKIKRTKIRGHPFMTSAKMTNFLNPYTPPSAKLNNRSIT